MTLPMPYLVNSLSAKAYKTLFTRDIFFPA
jgi:hypothetical protein